MKDIIWDAAAVAIIAATPVLAKDKMDKGKMEWFDAEMMKMNTKIGRMSAGSGKKRSHGGEPRSL